MVSEFPEDSYTRVSLPFRSIAWKVSIHTRFEQVYLMSRHGSINAMKFAAAVENNRKKFLVGLKQNDSYNE